MLSTPKDKRDGIRQGMEENHYPKITIRYAGKEFDCYLMSKDKLPPDLPLGIAQYTPTWDEWQACGQDQREIFFLLSSAVPSAFQRLWVLHELMEYMLAGIGTGCACEASSRGEIALVTGGNVLTWDEVPAYLTLRRTFFRQLLVFGERTKRDAHDMQAFGRSLNVFEAACRLFGVEDDGMTLERLRELGRKGGEKQSE
jgi:hypothetical protein